MREFVLATGPCDYLLFVGGKAAGVIEAKKAGFSLDDVDSLPPPDEIAIQIAENLQAALEAFQSVADELAAPR